MGKLRNPANRKETIHHNNNVVIWWSNDESNKTIVRQLLHRAIHNIFENMPPHLQVKYLVVLSCKSLKEEVKQQIFNALNTDTPEELYKPQTIKDIDKFIEWCKKYGWVDYKI